MVSVSRRRTTLAALAAAGISLALLGGSGAGSTVSGAPSGGSAPACNDLSCLNPMTEQARLAQFAGVQATRMGADSAAGLRAGINAKAALAAGPTVAGTNGTWQPLGVGPLISDDP